MYREFGLTGIFTSLIERKIRLEFTLDIHPDSATLDALILCEKESGRIIPLDILVSRQNVTLVLKEWPQAEIEYVLQIQSSKIRSIVDDELPDSILRTLVFKSEVLSTVDILTPSHHEELSELHLTWQENLSDKPDASLVSSYYLEVAKENAFYNIVKSTNVHDKQAIHLTDIPPGQYYIRIRAQKGEEYGRWSDTITFLMVNKQEVPEEPIFVRPIKIKESPANGETPTSFIFVFDEDIDLDHMPTIQIKRRPI